MRTQRTLLITTLAALVALASGCVGGAQFTKATGVSSYKPLDRDARVDVVEVIDHLQMPAIVLGEVTRQTRGSTPNWTAAIDALEVIARGRGCDALAGLDYTSRPLKRARVQHGTPSARTRAEAVAIHTWSARCVRTERARGGIHDRDREQTAAISL